MLEIDGSHGEGGGQIIRTSLGLSLLTGQPVHLTNVRAKRSRPGLQRQHLVSVLAAAEIGQAEVSGAAVGSQEICFTPRAVQPGDYTFDIGSAGSTTLVLQTLLPPLMVADAPSHLEIRGGTHNPLAPTAGFLNHAFAQTLGRFGPRLTVEARPFGFYPAGGGVLRVSIEPQAPLHAINLRERGAIVQRRAEAFVSRLPMHIAQRELQIIGQGLGWDDTNAELNAVDLTDTVGPGNALEITIRSEHATEVIAAFGERGKPAEEVARGAVDEALRYLAADVPVGEHLADQLLIPLALARGGSFVTLPPSLHATTNMRTIERFLPIRFAARELSAQQWLVEVAPAGA